jgi:putative sterol carrier protein
VIAVPEDLFLRIVRGEQSPMGAFLMGKIRVEGDVGLAMRLKDLLG